MHHYPTFLQTRPDQPDVPSCTTIPTVRARFLCTTVSVQPHANTFGSWLLRCPAEQSCQHTLRTSSGATLYHRLYRLRTLRSYYVGTASANVIHATTYLKPYITHLSPTESLGEHKGIRSMRLFYITMYRSGICREHNSIISTLSSLVLCMWFHGVVVIT